MTLLPALSGTPAVEIASPLLPFGLTDQAIDAAIADPILQRRFGRKWWIAFLVTTPFAIGSLVVFAVILGSGVGQFGINASVVWGYAIANYVWWIGIGNAGTLISSMLLLTRQDWRAAINRFAEAMTLFAVSIAGIFPIIHLGRPLYFYWLAPFPNTMTLWPQWRSALVWDFWAIVSYLLFSIVFWYTGALPDFATLRDRATPRARIFYGVLALGWRGSVRQWRLHGLLYRTLAALAVPLVCSVHSIVGLDFAASLMPGWQETIFPPYFVVGAMFSGFATVILLAVVIRWGFDLRAFLTPRHFNAMALILATASLVMGASYATEWFDAWYGGKAAERSVVAFTFSGTYAPLYWLLLFCNVVAPQALWWPRMRRSIAMLCAISVLVLVGMWLERILIIWNTLSHDYLPSQHRVFVSSAVDILSLVLPLGLFGFLFLLFVRIVPVLSLHELKDLRVKEQG